MLYDQFGRKIPGTDGGTPPRAGIMFVPDPVADREVFDASRGLTPRELDRIMTLANGGDVEGQCQLARELPEKNHDVAHALETRCNALLGCKWHITPGDDSPEARRAAETLEKELRGAGMLHPEIGVLEGCRGLLAVLCDGLLPGFAVAETIWKPGGAGFHGWRAIEPRFLSFSKSFSPRIRVNGNMSDGVPIPPGKAIYCRMGRPGVDPVRGGLIRPLAWLHCFANLNLKDLLGFIERYGMPFVTAKIDKATYDKERTLLNNLICNFGPRGGGVFSRGVELELLQASNNTGDVYFKLLEYLGDAITKVILGQTASSGDSAGLSGGDAQSRVRQDILDSDARAIEEAVNRDLVQPFMAYNYQPGTPIPRFELETAEPEDTAKLAETVKTLHDAGLQADPEEIGEKMGLKLTLRPEPTTDMSGIFDARGQAIRAGLLTATPELEEQTRREMGLPTMPPEAKKAWETGGVRQPITLKNAESEASVEMAENKPAPDASNSGLADALESWLGPAADQIADLTALSDEELDRKLRGGAPVKFGDSGKFEAAMTRDMEAAARHGNQVHR